MCTTYLLWLFYFEYVWHLCNVWVPNLHNWRDLRCSKVSLVASYTPRRGMGYACVNPCLQGHLSLGSVMFCFNLCFFLPDSGTSFECECRPGFTGLTCEVAIDDCSQVKIRKLDCKTVLPLSVIGYQPLSRTLRHTTFCHLNFIALDCVAKLAYLRHQFIGTYIKSSFVSRICERGFEVLVKDLHLLT